jgi:ligand-binding sensor domain-containing protein
MLYSQAYAQVPSYHVQILDESNGIQTAGINRILKDKNGFLWLLSPQYIQRYDGVSTKRFTVDDYLRDMVIDSAGTIWVTCLQSVYHFVDDYKGFVKMGLEAGEGTSFYSSATGRNDTVFFGSSTGIYYFDRMQNKIKNYFIKIITRGVGRARIAARHQYLYFIAGNDLCRYNMDTKEVLKHETNGMNVLEPLADDEVLVGWYDFSHSVLSFSRDELKNLDAGYFSPATASINQHFNGVSAVSDSEFLVCTSKGLLKYNSKTHRFVQQNLFLQGKPLSGDMRCLYAYQDDQKMFWVATPSSILYFKPFESTIGALHSYPSRKTAGWDEWVRSITEDNKGNIWFATANGFCKWDKKNGEVEVFPGDLNATDKMNFPSIRGLVYDGRNLLIGQTDKGIWIFNPETRQYKRPVYTPGPTGDSTKKHIETDFIFGITRLKNGNFFIPGRFSNYIMHRGNYLLEQISFDTLVIRGDYVLEDNKGFIWIYNNISSGAGLYCIDTSWHIVHFIPYKQQGDVRVLRPYCQLNDSTILCGHTGIKIVEHIHTRPVIHDILPALKNKAIRMIFKDRNEKIWIATYDELYRYTTASGLLERFDYSDNVVTSGTEASNVYRATDGTVYLGAYNGLNYFIPENIAQQNDELKVRLLNVSFGNDDSSFFLKDHFSVKYSQHAVVFSFVAPYFKNAQKVKYRYRLNGVDDDWVMAGNNTSVRYSSLRAGYYSFRAAASLDGITWYETLTPFSFSIRPPFWQTWWFRSLAVLLVVATVFYFVKRRINSIKTKAGLRLQLSQLEARALRSQMNPHFIFNSLNAISMLVAGGQNEKGISYLGKFSRLLRMVLDDAENNYTSIRDEIRILELYLQLESLRFGNSFQYKITVDPDLDKDVQIPSLLVHPLAENAVWHGLLHKEGDRQLKIELYGRG